MLFVELRFFFFFAVVFCVYWALRGNAARKVWLLACSYFFYSAFFLGDSLFGKPLPPGWWFPFVLLGSTCMDYVVGVKLEDTRHPTARKAWLMVSVCANIGVLLYFKYFNFFILSASSFLAWVGLPASLHTLQIILPYGVSFYTFQSLSYSIEVYRGHLKAERNPLDLAFFIAFFPQLVAGPIVRAMTFLPQTKSTRSFANVDVRAALVLFMTGFVKKACVADGVAPYVDQYFGDPGKYNATSAWVAVLFYAVQIYCDFSGYTDMAIAAARLLGYELTVNFNFPYFADSITDFWRRWHISLSTWLRDYLYISLGGNRGSKLFVYRNLLLTMFLGGLWHGARWTFAIWGAIHGLALIVHREWLRLRGVERKREGQIAEEQAIARRSAYGLAGKVLAVAFTFYWICITWIFFRAADLSKPMTGADFTRAKTVLQAFVFFHGKGRGNLGGTLLWVFAGLAIVHWLNYKRVFSTWWRKGPDMLFAAGYGCAWALVLLFVPMRYAPFIYFQF
jgi:D-alanyl-lipoteichoic acid acyltransferase DltB (MBOAT superfamily)